MPKPHRATVLALNISISKKNKMLPLFHGNQCSYTTWICFFVLGKVASQVPVAVLLMRNQVQIDFGAEVVIAALEVIKGQAHNMFATKYMDFNKVQKYWKGPAMRCTALPGRKSLKPQVKLILEQV